MPAKYHVENECLKREYFDYLKEAKRYSEASVDGVAKALHRFESYTRFKAFRLFHIGQAKGFKVHLAEQVNLRTNERLSKATLNSTLAALRSFFVWLATQPGFKSRISYSDADYFNLSEKEVRIATTPREKRVPTLDEVQHVIRCMPSQTSIEKRNRAVIAATLLTGARDGALASLKLKHVDIAEGKIVQDAREVRTKFSKTFSSWFFPVGDDIREIVEEWVRYLIEVEGFGPEDPLFPSTRVAPGLEQQFEAVGVERKHWSSATPIRAIFRQACAAAGVAAFNPHRVRDTLALLGQQLTHNFEEYKAWSQNLGHERMTTTFSSYGPLAPARQAEIIRSIGVPRADALEAELRQVLARFR